VRIGDSTYNSGARGSAGGGTRGGMTKHARREMQMPARERATEKEKKGGKEGGEAREMYIRAKRGDASGSCVALFRLKAGLPAYPRFP